MNSYKCFCGVCKKEHDYKMTAEEFKMLINVVKDKSQVMESGRINIACDECHPMKYSVRKDV